MKGVRYTKYNGDLAFEMDLESLLQALSDFFLDSGFNDPYSNFGEMDNSLDALREALRQILESGEFFDEDTQRQINEMSAAGKLDELIDKLIERMQQESYISTSGQPDPTRASQAGGEIGEVEGEVRFEVTDKSLDFLGFKTLRDLLGSLGKSSLGRHDTRHWATGIESTGPPRLYEFGDTLNLDTTATLSSVREGAPGRLGLPLNLEYDDLHVHQCDYQLLRHRRHARLLALHDPLRRGPLHARQARRHGALASHPHAVSRRLTQPRPLPRLRRRDCPSRQLPASRSAPTTPTPAKASASRSASSPASART
jgi:Ca-activated chloride channel family protein